MNLSEVVPIAGEFSGWCRFGAKSEIKRRIRRLLGERIRGLIYKLSQDLKHQISFPGSVAVLAILAAEGHVQHDLRSFQSADESNGPTSSITNESSEGRSADEQTADEEIDPTDARKGLIYARVSSNKQIESEDGETGPNKGSIEGQIEEMKTIAEQRSIELPYEPIVDEAQTGTNFDRDGIKEVFDKARRAEISYLLVEKVDRIGRNAPETLYFIYLLQSECDVTLLTSSGLEQDVGEAEGLLHTTLMSLMAEIQNDLRTTKAKKERIRGFFKQRNWNCKSPKTPLGYTETDDGWLEVDPEEKPIVRDMFRRFVDCGKYSQTKRYIEKTYGKDVLDGHRIKTLLEDATYIGRPKLPEDWLAESTYENNLETQELNLLAEDENSDIDVTKDVFHQAQELIEEKNAKHSTDDDANDLLDFIEEYSLFTVIQSSTPAKLVHDCGTPLIKDGQVTLKGNDTKIHKYVCPECEAEVDARKAYRRWPKEHELNQMDLIQKLRDGVLSLFDDTN